MARAVDAVADEMGATSSQVALAWTRAHHRRIHPVIGARTVDQLTDNLAALDLTLSEDRLRRLDEVSAIELGFPTEFIGATSEFVYGPVGRNVDGRM